MGGTNRLRAISRMPNSKPPALKRNTSRRRKQSRKKRSAMRPSRPSSNGVGKAYHVIRKRLSSLKPSPENLQIYRDSDADDPENVKLEESIRRHGLREPLVITADGYIVSGHRRYAALCRIGQVMVPCIVLNVRRDSMTTDEYIALLRDHNRQRHKSVAEQIREEMIDSNPEDAYSELCETRDNSIYALEGNDVATLEIEGSKTRHEISPQKADHVKYVKKVVFEDRRSYWPLSVRAVHYALLNYQFLRNILQKIRYLNDKDSYKATSGLITRLRLTGEIPWEAFSDETRPITEFRPFSDARQFVRQQVDRLLAGYWRDLLQTQPNHVEVVCEKNSIYHMVLRVTRQFQIPTSSGRGFNSIDPWHELYGRYIDSGCKRLIVIVLSDHDPEGQMIPQVGGRTLRDDFGVEDLEIIQAGVTREQIEEYDLPQQNYAKESSSNHDWFVERNDGDNTIFELEALDPADMLNDLETVITSVLDMDLFNLEAEREQDEAAYLQAARKAAAKALKGLGE